MQTVQNLEIALIQPADLFYGLVGLEVFFKCFCPFAVSEHDVIGDWSTGTTFGLHVRPVLCRQVKPNNQIALWNIDTFFHNAGCDEQVGFMRSELPQDLDSNVNQQ